jgi:methyl-accepting chemotaxis protein
MGNLSLSRLSTRARIQLLAGLALLGLAVLCLILLFHLKSGMLEGRKREMRALVEVATGIVVHYHQLASSGKLPEEEAKNAARADLRNMRYGKGDYYFVLDPHGVHLVHGGKPASEGTQSLDLKDVKGKFIVREFIAAAKAGGGFVEYWYPHPGEQEAQPKLTYSALFAPWDWIIGTGIYIDDIDHQFRESVWLAGAISLLLLVLLAISSWRIGLSILRQLGGEPALATATMQRVAGGDLSTHIDSMQRGSMLDALGGMVAALRQMVGDIDQDANRLVNSAEQIARASDEVTRAAEQQTDATSAMAAAVEQLSVSSNHISDSAREASRHSQTAVALSDQGAQRVQQASEAIQKISTTVSGASELIVALEERVVQVSSIANVIKEIAGQTNLLALNAAIEAARAGEQGRGFAVVADEVRKLAERTAGATGEIEQMISGIQADTTGAVAAINAALPEVKEGVSLADSASESLQAIGEGARRTLARVGEIADATREQSSASTLIAQRVEQIVTMVGETSATIHGTAVAAHGLEDIAHRLKTMTGRFQV